MSRSGLRFLLALSVVLNLSFLGAAGYRYLGERDSWTSPFGAKMARDHFLFEELSLSPEQRQAMRARAIPFRAEIDRQRAEIAARRKDLIALMREGAPDAAALEAAVARLNALQERMQQQITRHMLTQKALLDPAQQVRFLDLIEKAMTESGGTGCLPAGRD